MRVTILQTDIEWAQPQVNIRKAEELMRESPASDLYILPEMFSTGFCTLPEGVAETEGMSLEWMKRKAAEADCAIAGSVATKVEDKFYNRFYFVYPSGEVRSYDKKHLFTFGGEHKHFTAGSERTIVNFRGVRILLQICYDLRFPVFSRNRKDYDMIIYVASWPSVRIEAWKTLIRARAIENQCYVAAVNRVGRDPYCEYCGGSEIIDPYGHTIARCADEQIAVAAAEIDMEALTAFRQKFPVLDDSDDFTLK